MDEFKEESRPRARACGFSAERRTAEEAGSAQGSENKNIPKPASKQASKPTLGAAASDCAANASATRGWRMKPTFLKGRPSSPVQKNRPRPKRSISRLRKKKMSLNSPCRARKNTATESMKDMVEESAMPQPEFKDPPAGLRPEMMPDAFKSEMRPELTTGEFKNQPSASNAFKTQRSKIVFNEVSTLMAGVEAVKVAQARITVLERDKVSFAMKSISSCSPQKVCSGDSANSKPNMSAQRDITKKKSKSWKTKRRFSGAA